VASRDMAQTAHFSGSMAAPETLEALEECRARIELLSHVNETRLRELSKKQLVGVVGDLLAMAARQEFERERRFENATSSASVRRANEKAERAAALQRQRDREEDAKGVAIRKAEYAAAVVIQKLARGNATRAKAHHRAEAVKSYERDVKQAERRAKETAKREQASVSIQSVFRARRARIEAKRLWLQAWAKGRETQNIRGVVVSKHSPEQWTRVEVVEHDVYDASENETETASTKARKPDGYVFFAEQHIGNDRPTPSSSPTQVKKPSLREPVFRLESDSEDETQYTFKGR
jgi:hypothetical protein